MWRRRGSTPQAPAARPPAIGAAGGTASDSRDAGGATVIVPAGAFETDTTASAIAMPLHRAAAPCFIGLDGAHTALAARDAALLPGPNCG